jgi:hypothetical protein
LDEQKYTLGRVLGESVLEFVYEYVLGDSPFALPENVPHHPMMSVG